MVEAIAKHPFEATSDDELSFRKGSVLKILQMSEKQWYKAEQNGREGFVPASYISLKDCSFLNWTITRDGANQALKDQFNGAYLIRGSESTPGDFTLSVKYGDGVQHFKVLRDGAGKYFLWLVKFNSLNELVDYHRTSSVSRTQHILLRDMQDTQVVMSVQAMYDFEPKETGELAFRKGDIIKVTNKEGENWWTGRISGQTEEGIFPANYVKEM